MPAMSETIRVAAVKDIPEGGCLHLRIDGTGITLFRQGGRVHALRSECPHRGGPLGEGLVRDGVVTCPWHGYRFDLATGRSVEPVGHQVKTFPVRERNGEVEIEWTEGS